jgi:hypothetical protein
MTQRGADLAYGRTLPRLLPGAGLVDVEVDAFFPMTKPACTLLEQATIAQIRERLAAGAATNEEIDQHLANVTTDRRSRDLSDDLCLGSQANRKALQHQRWTQSTIKIPLRDPASDRDDADISPAATSRRDRHPLRSLPARSAKSWTSRHQSGPARRGLGTAPRGGRNYWSSLTAGH